MNENVDLHMTELATWMVRTFGRALMASLVIPAVLAVVGVFADLPGLVVIGLVIGPFIFAWRLMDAAAPFPTESDENSAS